MALGVDLFGLNDADEIIWRRMCRLWDGGHLLTILGDRLKPAEPPPSWECVLTVEEVPALAANFDKPDMLSWYPNDADLGELLHQVGTNAVLLRIEEWGFG